MKANFAVCIFSHCHRHAPDIKVQKTVLQSLARTFQMGEITLYFFIDQHPRSDAWGEYKSNLSNICRQLGLTKVFFHKTESLYEGYKLIDKVLEGDYFLFLEHDWSFLNSNIEHSLSDIVSWLSRSGINYIRFNKRENVPKVWDEWLEPHPELPLVKTPAFSNNPHIITRKHYQNVLNVLSQSKESTHNVAIEKKSAEDARTQGCYIYGDLNHPPTVKHIGGEISWKLESGLYPMEVGRQQ